MTMTWETILIEIWQDRSLKKLSVLLDVQFMAAVFACLILRIRSAGGFDGGPPLLVILSCMILRRKAGEGIGRALCGPFEPSLTTFLITMIKGLGPHGID